MIRMSLVLSLAALAGGCVSAKHRELQDAYTQMSDENARLRESLTAEGRTLESLDARNAALAGANSELASTLDEKERALAELRKREAIAAERVEEYRDLAARFASMIDAGKLSVRIIDGRMVVQMPSDILFPSGSDQVSAEGKAQLMEVGKVLGSIDRAFQVEGHTDSDAIRTERFPSNWALSSGRATTVLETLVEAGVPKDRLSIAGFADMKPVASNKSETEKAQNRRIEIVLQPDLSMMPGFEELEQIAQDALAADDPTPATR